MGLCVVVLTDVLFEVDDVLWGCVFVVVLTDVLFEVDDGHVAAHKVLLMAGCEMMNAMFSNSFLESSADVVSSSSPPSPLPHQLPLTYSGLLEM